MSEARSPAGDSQSDPGVPDVDGSEVEPSRPDEPWKTLDVLTEAERSFVLAALQGKEWSDCGRKAGISTELGIIRWLGRQNVRAALEALAPLAAAIDPKRAARILLPYGAGRLASTMRDGSDAQALGAIKELLSVAGVTGGRERDTKASLADALGVLAQRISDARPKRLPEKRVVIDVTPAPASDSKSGALDASIWDVPSGAQESKPEAGRPAGKGRGKRGRG